MTRPILTRGGERAAEAMSPGARSGTRGAGGATDRGQTHRRALVLVRLLSQAQDDRRRDLDVKRREYAQAGIPESWIVDPREEGIVALRLGGDRYVEHGTYGRGQRAASHLLPGFEVDVVAALAGRG